MAASGFAAILVKFKFKEICLRMDLLNHGLERIFKSVWSFSHLLLVSQERNFFEPKNQSKLVFLEKENGVEKISI